MNNKQVLDEIHRLQAKSIIGQLKQRSHKEQEDYWKELASRAKLASIQRQLKHND